MSTPLMTQYRRIKSENSGAILLFRMGDFYEMFDEDALAASKVLSLTLTSRNHGESSKTPLCGFPYHALDRYMARLVKAGHRVAVCEQVQDPKEAKGLVDRDIVEVVTRGTAVSPDILPEKSNNFLLAVTEEKGRFGLAGADVSTGEFFSTEVTADRLAGEAAKLRPAEILFPEGDTPRARPAWLSLLPGDAVMTPLEAWRFSHDTARRDLTAHFKTATLEGFGVDAQKLGLAAAGALFHYVRELKKGRVDHFRRLAPLPTGRSMALDGATIRNLEILNPLNPEDEKGTLLYVLDRTKTAMGGRLLRRILVNPLLALDEITARQDAVALLFEDSRLRDTLRELLASVADIERLNGRIGGERVTPRDLGGLRSSLITLDKAARALPKDSPTLLAGCATGLSGNAAVTEKLAASLLDELPLTLSDGNLFRPGYSAELDTIIEGAREGREWIAGLQGKERERTGVSSLKVGFTNVFGYYIEISKANLDRIPEGYIRKQTLVNGERFITEELKVWEDKVLSAEEKQKKVEAALFGDLRKWLCGHLPKLQQTAEAAALLDCMLSLADTAAANRYVRPVLDDSGLLEIDEGRHPVVENLDLSEPFVPNTTRLGGPENFIHLITGPNMAGKSTYLRQTGLIVLLAQAGSFVPARSARIGIADRIFTRVGASDRLAKGLSTFLVEMQELANILNNAGPKSLVLLDEIGRGTSTFDGLSIAWALVEHIHEKNRSRTLFATHYHELADLPLVLKGVKNFNVSVKEWNDEIIFLRKIVEGACDHSYGIQVARLAGVPAEVVRRAKEVLKNLESNELTPDSQPALARHENNEKKVKAEERQLSFFDATNHDVLEIIRKLDLNSMTPMEALLRLSEIQKRLSQ